MKRRHYTRFIRIGWVLVILLLLLGIFATPGPSASASRLVMHNRQDTVALDAKVYLTQSMLKPLFQDRINQQVPGAVSGAINGIVNNLPGVNQAWAGQMARSLLQPSATLTQLTPRQDGLDAAIRLSLYPNDPKPTDSHLLVKFSVQDASTVQVSAQPLNGGPALVNGPLTTIKIPLGQLKAINATPNCGDANLAIGLQVPVDLTQTGSQPTQGSQGNVSSGAQTAQLSYIQASTRATMGPSMPMLSTLIDSSTLQSTQQTQQTQQAAPVSSYIEIPANSLANLGNGVGTIQLSRSLSAQNIQLSVQGSQILVLSDIVGSFLGAPIKLATAITTILPEARDGRLALTVQSTRVTVAIITFSQNSYNSQIQQLLNDKLSNALGSGFNVTAVSLGNNTNISCAAPDSLMLTGTASL